MDGTLHFCTVTRSFIYKLSWPGRLLFYPPDSFSFLKTETNLQTPLKVCGMFVWPNPCRQREWAGMRRNVHPILIRVIGQQMRCVFGRADVESNWKLFHKLSNWTNTKGVKVLRKASMAAVQNTDFGCPKEMTASAPQAFANYHEQC